MQNQPNVTPNNNILLLNNMNLNETTPSIFNPNTPFLTITHLDLSNNSFTSLPQSLTQFTSLMYLNLSNNPISNYDQVISILTQLPHLTSLKIDLTTKQNVSKILTALPNLLILNDHSTKEEIISIKEIDISDEEIENISFNQDIAVFNTLIEDIISNIITSSDALLYKNQFMSYLTEQINVLNSYTNVSNFIFAVHVIKTKIAVYNYLYELINSIIVSNINGDAFVNIIKLFNNINNKLRENEEYLCELILKMYPKFEEKFLYYQKECFDYKKKYMQVNEMLNEKDKLNKMLYESNKQLQQRVNVIETENKTTNNIKPTDDDINEINNILNKQPINNNNTLITNNKRTKPKKDSLTSSFNSNYYIKNTLHNNKTTYSPNKLKQTNHFIHNISSHPNRTLHKSSSYKCINTSSIAPKNLSQKQLLQIITEIYSSKSAYDMKCIKYHLPKETLEQHMYTYLNNKYGLKNLTIEWATSIIKGIKQHSQSNPEICLFGKILRNDIEEDTYQVFLKLKSTVIDLLTYMYQTKYKYKSATLINKLIKEKQNGFLFEEEWTQLLQYLFPQDNESICEKIFEFINKHKCYYDKYEQTHSLGNVGVNRRNSGMTREEIRECNEKEIDKKILYCDFIHLLLEIQIRLRDKYLFNFVTMFRQCDGNEDGVLNEDEFKMLVIKLNVYNESDLNKEIERLIEKIDPFNTQVFTFNDCVVLFGNEFVEDGKVLDKVAMMDMNNNNNENDNNNEN